MYEHETSRRINKEIAYLLSHALLAFCFLLIYKIIRWMMIQGYNIMVRRWIMHLRRKRYHASKNDMAKMDNTTLTAAMDARYTLFTLHTIPR